jgi:hypothetical protein
VSAIVWEDLCAVVMLTQPVASTVIQHALCRAYRDVFLSLLAPQLIMNVWDEYHKNI